jgi:DNA-binding response OmpR family regulator
MASGFVLICDDDVLLTELLEHRLGLRGYETAVARDGGEALAMIEQRLPDAVILESMLHVHDGPELLRRIRANPGTKDLPMIVLTSRNRERDILEALALGASDYVTKPFSPEELIARMARCMTRPGR